MAHFDPTEYQEFPNGPLRDELIARLVAVKELRGLSYAKLAAPSGLSGAFFHHLINNKGNVSTQHVLKIVKALEALEAGDMAETAPSNTGGLVSHSFHLRPNLQVALQLPGDLTDKEADRLAKFVLALPMI
ncbi:MAG: hypothetical protein QOH47_2621 [Sphingomonadales bacterium]|jgi:DNA-binding phage protein|nr:hypothetical protein [Sphingomonadales bacterium]